jgi:hypothetical protein
MSKEERHEDSHILIRSAVYRYRHSMCISPKLALSERPAE